jgi:catechol 2,3-dioxygenase-like lactoylglutathione lyase family enzyme
MFDHLGFDVRDLQKSKNFYEAVLAVLGSKLLVYSEEWQAAGFGSDRPRFWIAAGKPTNSEKELHLCFAAKNRAEVKKFYEVAIAAGAKDNGPPGLRPQYHKDYFGAFVLDPDGHNIEACCHLPE